MIKNCKCGIKLPIGRRFNRREMVKSINKYIHSIANTFLKNTHTKYFILDLSEDGVYFKTSMHDEVYFCEYVSRAVEDIIKSKHVVWST